MSQHLSNPSDPPRRNFLKEAAAVALGGVAVLVPMAAGVAVLLDPLRRKAASLNAIRVASLSALPADGVPRKFPVLASRTDAWNKYPDVPIGAVYLRRVSEKEITALNVACPHAGCFVDFSTDKKLFLCPCHNSSFAVDGKIKDRASPSPRPLDSLEVEIRGGTEIWIRFQNFEPGEKAKIPVA
jgi:menaquinol-cytochrome c reductase iron-sulfur subunit